MAMVQQKRGQYRIIRVDGTESVIGERPAIKKIEKAINCDCCDTVRVDRQNRTVMVVDDMGMYRKPVNPKATELVHRALGARYPYRIHGDVAIVNDEDFE